MSRDKDKFKNMADAVAGVKPLVTDKLHIQVRPAAPRAAFTRADNQAVLEESLAAPDIADLETGEELFYRSPGVAESIFRKLRRGQLSISAELDLHGLNAKEAKQHLLEFMAEAGRYRYSCVRIVHGKGNRSGQRGPVLKNKVNRWLRRWSAVLAFCSARPVDGGTGAVYVLLRKP